MNFYLDTEFLEGKQSHRPRWTNALLGVPKPTIDLISIGIIADDGREYYAISKDFNLKEAWNRFDLKPATYLNGSKAGKTIKQKVYWLRENVLRSIFTELREKELHERGLKMICAGAKYIPLPSDHFTYRNLKKLIKKYGKSQIQIANEIVAFVYNIEDVTDWGEAAITYINSLSPDDIKSPPVFYAYFADYDWVVFCWIFGRVMNLPKGFPMYCRDLKQMMAERNLNTDWKDAACPSPANEHNALADARWNKQLHEAIDNFVDHEIPEKFIMEFERTSFHSNDSSNMRIVVQGKNAVIQTFTPHQILRAMREYAAKYPSFTAKYNSPILNDNLSSTSGD